MSLLQHSGRWSTSREHGFYGPVHVNNHFPSFLPTYHHCRILNHRSIFSVSISIFELWRWNRLAHPSVAFAGTLRYCPVTRLFDYSDFGSSSSYQVTFAYGTQPVPFTSSRVIGIYKKPWAHHRNVFTAFEAAWQETSNFKHSTNLSWISESGDNPALKNAALWNRVVLKTVGGMLACVAYAVAGSFTAKKPTSHKRLPQPRS